MNKLKIWYAGLKESDQRALAILSIFLGVTIVVAGILLPLNSAVSRAVKGSETRREDLTWMRAHATEIRGGDIPPETNEAPVVLVDRIGREVGLGAALRGTQPNTTGGVRVQLEGAPFDILVAWLDTLDRRYGLTTESITVDRTASPGLVNASISFSAPRH